MQNDTFKLPSEESKGPRGQAGPIEARGIQPEAPTGEYRPTTRERLGQLGLDEGLERIARNDENKEWPESHTETPRELIDYGAALEKEREAIENNFGLAA